MRRPALAALAALIAIAASVLLWQTQKADATTLIARIPAVATFVIGVDVAALRASGMLERLAGPREMESAEYREFLTATRFDYRKDLDYAVVGLSSEGHYFALRGRFDWPTLERYATSNSGACEQGSCRLRTDSGRDAMFTLAEPSVLTVFLGPGFHDRKRFQSPSGVAWAVLDDPPDLFQGATKIRVTVESAFGGLTARLLADCPDESVQPALAARLQAVLQRLQATSHDGITKGSVTLKKKSVEVTWRLDPKALLSLDLGRPD